MKQSVFSIDFSLRNLVDSSATEKHLETNLKHFNTVVKEVEAFNKQQLRDSLTKQVLDSLHFPYKTKNAVERRKEIFEWLDNNPAYKTNNINLLKQRIINTFIVELPKPDDESETLNDFLEAGKRYYEQEEQIIPIE